MKSSFLIIICLLANTILYAQEEYKYVSEKSLDSTIINYREEWSHKATLLFLQNDIVRTYYGLGIIKGDKFIYNRKKTKGVYAFDSTVKALYNYNMFDVSNAYWTNFNITTAKKISFQAKMGEDWMWLYGSQFICFDTLTKTNYYIFGINNDSYWGYRSINK
jgi:hypothetical protein